MASRRSHLTLIALLVAALAGVVLLGLPGSPMHRTLRQGLDLQGGLEVVLQAQPPRGQTLTQAEMSNSISIMRSRVDKLGVSEPLIRQQGSNQIVIQLPAVHNPDQAAAIIGQTAVLELYDLTPALFGPSIDATQGAVAHTQLYDLLTLVQSGQSGTPSAYYLFNSRTKKLVAGPDQTLRQLKQEPVVRALKPVLAKTVTVKVKGKTTKKVIKPGKTTPGFPTGYQLFTVPAKAIVITCDSKVAVGCPSGTSGLSPTPGVTYYYLFKHGSFSGDTESPYPQMTGKDLKLSGTQADVDPTTGQPIVTMQFTSEGNKLFHQVTRNEAQRGQELGVQQSFAIVLDSQIYSFPTIDYTKYADGINPAGTGAEITGLASTSEAQHLALVLQTGALPVKFTTIERTDVSATLGKDSLRQARDAAIAGLLLVAIFLLLLYRFLGLVAVIGLGIYAAFMYGAILLLNVTLTLPGFAGLILTIGVAADANVVIFERIKEEARAGRSVRAAIATGYAKGFRTIVDANVVTAITALVLFAVATAEVKGFALMLLIGTVVSLVTAVAATRAMLGLLAGFRWFEKPAFMGAAKQQRGHFLQIDFMRRRYLWFAISGAVILIGAVSLGVRGLNFGIDFKGGVQINFKTAVPTSLQVVRKQAAAIGRGDAVVQGTGKSVGADSYKSFQMQLKKLSTSAQTKLTNDLQNTVHAQALGVKNVSSSFGRQIADAAILAIVFSLFLIVLYCTIRFDLKYAVPVIIAMLHDVLITVGVYSLTGREVTSSTVAAVLTVLGYSIYDTIIIFDRIRENVPLMKRSSFATIANVSLWETIRRSLATTFITLLPVGSLLFFGGATLKDFAFALIVGITSGAYSSIFIAAPLLTMWKERETEYRGRIGEVLEGSRADRVLKRAERLAARRPTPETPMDEVEEAFDRVGENIEEKIEKVVDGGSSADAKRERRRQRRQTRPHGRPR